MEFGDRGFIQPDRAIDFLVDDYLIKPEDVIFFIETPIDYEHELNNRSYTYVRMWELLKHVRPRDFWGVPLFGLRRIYTHLVWSVALRMYDINHYVVYNDFAPQALVRNRLMRKRGIQTWYYIHSCNYLDRYGIDDTGTVMNGMEYDHMVVWGGVEKYMERMGNKIGKYHKLGCLWGSE